MTAGPDKGLSWFIAMDCFLINFITVGIARTIGVLYVELIGLYGISREAATTPFSIRVFTTNMTGPFVGLLGQKYGIRRIMVIGGLVASLGSILCSFATNILWISIFWGLIHGLGFGLSTCLHMLTINEYFYKYRGTALGFGYSGDCFGNFAFPFIIEYLIAEYGAQGTFLIIGGILLNILPMALLLRNPPWVKKESSGIKTRTRKSWQPSVKEQHTDISTFQISKDSKNGSYLNRLSNKNPNHGDSAENQNDYCKVQDNFPQFKNNLFLHFYSSEVDLSELCAERGLQEIENFNLAFSEFSRESCGYDLGNKNQMTYTCIKSLHARKKNTDLFNRSTKSLPSSFKSTRSFKESIGKMKYTESSAKSADFDHKVTCSDLKETITNEKCMGQAADCKRTLSLATQIDPNSFLITGIHVPGIKSKYRKKFVVENKYHDAHNDVSKELVLSAANIMTDNYLRSNFKQSEDHLKNKERTQSMVKVFFRTIIKPMFILMSISSALYAFLLTSILTIFIDYAADQGIPNNKGKYFIIGFSLADLVGRLVFGQVIDRNLIKIKNYVVSIMFLMGMLSSVMPLNINFYYMMTCMCLYGVVQGGAAIMFPILLNTYLDGSTHSVAMGCLNFYGGILILLLPSTIHFFRDNTGSYNNLFYINGAIVAITGFVWLFEPMILKFQLRRLEATH